MLWHRNIDPFLRYSGIIPSSTAATALTETLTTVKRSHGTGITGHVEGVCLAIELAGMPGVAEGSHLIKEIFVGTRGASVEPLDPSTSRLCGEKVQKILAETWNVKSNLLLCWHIHKQFFHDQQCNPKTLRIERSDFNTVSTG